MDDRERDVNESRDADGADVGAGDLAAATAWWVAARSVLGFEPGGDDDGRQEDRSGRSLPVWPLAFAIAGVGVIASLAGTDGDELGSWFARAIKAAGSFALENPVVTGGTLAAVFGAYAIGQRVGTFTGTGPLERAAIRIRSMGRRVRDRGVTGAVQDIDYAISRIVNPSHWNADTRQRAFRVLITVWSALAIAAFVVLLPVILPVVIVVAIPLAVILCIWLLLEREL